MYNSGILKKIDKILKRKKVKIFVVGTYLIDQFANMLFS